MSYHRYRNFVIPCFLLTLTVLTGTGAVLSAKKSVGRDVEELIAIQSDAVATMRISRSTIGVAPEPIVEGQLALIQGSINPNDKNAKPSVSPAAIDSFVWFPDNGMTAKVVAAKNPQGQTVGIYKFLRQGQPKPANGSH